MRTLASGPWYAIRTAEQALALHACVVADLAGRQLCVLSTREELNSWDS